ncbi:TMPIT-like protein [Dunaliella salina]|uniref:TMPIT-like protein n=1 Tax=Dunaliella salina TaxID=3046 RepID=A0ABQ7H5Y4_DUNSA|nr:TMPIT-like protein [Dunaliella salina]|eukprot:KAF5842206.1 TMPIT-like protein [Dunaliella salina]
MPCSLQIKSLQQAISDAKKKALSHPDVGVAREVLAELQQAQQVVEGLGPGGDLRKFCKTKHPALLRLLMGDKVSVIAFRADHSAAMKEEYHRFRDKSALVMLLLPAMLLLGLRRADALREASARQEAGLEEHLSFSSPFAKYTFVPGLMTGVQFYFLWLGYFYLAVALRESVLLVNGSHIKSWWIQHHCWSAACALLMLGLPVYSQAVKMLCQYFLMWSCFQALVMMVQNMYQRRRMYTRIAMGKNTAMDVVTGESSGTSGQLLLLYPLLFVLQGSQFAIGAGVAYQTFPSLLAPEGWFDVEAVGSDLRGMRGVCLVGLAFCYMAVRNFGATVQTITEKKKVKYERARLTGKKQG